MPPFLLKRTWMLLFVACAACGARDTTYSYDVVDGYRFTTAERHLIEQIADATLLDVRRALPALPRQMIVRVQPGKKVIPETGETGSNYPPNVIYATFDPGRPGGVAGIVRSQLRPLLLHECHHLVRGVAVRDTSLMDQVVAEGLATAFERDFGGASPPWGAYDDGVETWARELMMLPPDAPRDVWMKQHSDGRRWVGYKAGTYLVDRATRATGRSAADLVSTPAADIITMAWR